MKQLHMICNAHLDPYWQWEWEEGAAEALSTFRAAADLCEEYGDLVFNHNEVILYQWVELYEPVLFERIQRLVKEGKWHIMGGWYVQPDCNLPCGESFVRQALLGRTYFAEKFGVAPSTAINFDPFGHTRGLVQILKKSGFDSYIFCRPDNNDCPLPANDFIWVGYDGSEIAGRRAAGYNSFLGEARAKVEGAIANSNGLDNDMVLWGVGNHGGGPSRKDLNDLAELKAERKDIEILHSTPERFFSEMAASGVERPRHEGDLNPWAAGCYTSMIRIKQKHRLMEDELFATEKMLSAASMQGLMPYPKDDLHKVECDLATAQFHDILPGSSIQPVEEAAIRLMDHGLEILSRHKAHAFFALCEGEAKAGDGEIPVLIYNPHPYPIKGIFQCEFGIPDFSLKDQFSVPVVFKDGQPVPCQVEKELSSLNLDWRKRTVFVAELAPSQVTRFDCTLRIEKERPRPEIGPENGVISFKTDELDIEISCETGLISRFAVNSKDLTRPGAFQPVVMNDNEDPWAMRVKDFRDEAGRFTLMSRETGTAFSAIHEGTIDSVRVIEDGPVRTVVEAVMEYGNSAICQTYKLPKHGTEIEIEVRVHWNEKDKMLKWCIPTAFDDADAYGRQAFGVEHEPDTGWEFTAQRWVSVASKQTDVALSCITDSAYGFDFKDNELRVSLLRSPGFCAHPIEERQILPQDRYLPRIDQGERLFKFWLNASAVDERLEKVDRESTAVNQRPFTLSFFPSGQGKRPEPIAFLQDDVIHFSALKKAEMSDDYIVRLFEPTGTARSTRLQIPLMGIDEAISFTPFEVKTFRIDTAARKLVEVDMMESCIKL